MNRATVTEALSLPLHARLDRKIPKKALLEQVVASPSDRGQLRDGIEELQWLAALKPTNIGVREYKDDEREYLEIAVLTVILRPEAKSNRIIELIHRTIPYPVLLIAEDGPKLSLSAAHKRLSHGESGKVVTEELHRTHPFNAVAPSLIETQFTTSLSLSLLPSSDLLGMYQGFIDRISALKVAQITGIFTPQDSSEQATTWRLLLKDYEHLQSELKALRAQALKENQLNHRVQLNIDIKNKEGKLAALLQGLSSD